MYLWTSLRLLILSAAFYLLSGCAVNPPAETPLPEKPLGSLNSWTMEGKLGFRSPQKNGSAWINWQQAGTGYSLHLSRPFGAKATQIEGNEDYAVLRQAGEKELVAPNAQTLTARLFGWPLPVEQMTQWVKARPSSSAAGVVYNDSGQVESLEQDGWHLEYSNYQRQDSWTLPGKIRGTKGDIAFTLVVKSWKTP